MVRSSTKIEKGSLWTTFFGKTLVLGFHGTFFSKLGITSAVRNWKENHHHTTIPALPLTIFPCEGSQPFGSAPGSLVTDTANSRNYNWSVIFCTFEAYAVATAGIQSLHGR